MGGGSAVGGVVVAVVESYGLVVGGLGCSDLREVDSESLHSPKISIKRS